MVDNVNAAGNRSTVFVPVADFFLFIPSTIIFVLFARPRFLSRFVLFFSRAFPLSAVSYILILTVSWLVFEESISLLQLIGSGLILAGVWLISTAGREALPETGQESVRSELRLVPPSRLSPRRSAICSFRPCRHSLEPIPNCAPGYSNWRSPRRSTNYVPAVSTW